LCNAEETPGVVSPGTVAGFLEGGNPPRLRKMVYLLWISVLVLFAVGQETAQSAEEGAPPGRRPDRRVPWSQGGPPGSG